MPRRIPLWIWPHLFSECSSRYWSMADPFMWRTRTSWFPPIRTHSGQTELTVLSQPKSQSPYAVASGCVIAAPFNGAKICDFRVEQLSLACHYDTGMVRYCTIVPMFTLHGRILAIKFATSSCANSSLSLPTNNYPPTST
jgi:hypothetical protein